MKSVLNAHTLWLARRQSRLVMHVFQLIVPSILGVIGVYALGENIGKLVSKANFARKNVDQVTEAEPVDDGAGTEDGPGTDPTGTLD